MQAELFQLIGKITIYGLIIILILLAIAAILLAISLRQHRFYLPNLTVALLVFFRGFFKAVFRLLRLEDTSIDQLYVDTALSGLERGFFTVPTDRRAVFIPQCLRSVECPARLSPEGIACKQCGRCRVGEAKQVAEELGYKFFIVPGSSFIKRAVGKHRPEAVLGIGCLVEIREGIEMIQRHGLPVYAIQLETTGCVNTTYDENTD